MNAAKWLLGLVAGWLTTTLLLVLNVPEPYAIGTGWLVFILTVTALPSHLPKERR